MFFAKELLLVVYLFSTKEIILVHAMSTLYVPCVYQEPEERSVPTEAESNLPVRLLESPVDTWIDSLTWGQTIGRELSPTIQQKTGLKI